jgi:hypothetical protein
MTNKRKDAELTKMAHLQVRGQMANVQEQKPYFEFSALRSTATVERSGMKCITTVQEP